MSWSWETVDAVISGGLPGTPVLFPTTDYYSFTGSVKFASHTLWGFNDVQPVAAFKDIYDLNSAHTLTVFTPDKVKRGIVKWELSNGNGGLDYYLGFLDANGNHVYDIPLHFNYDWSQQGKNFYDWLDLIGWDEYQSLPTFANVGNPIYLCFSANYRHDDYNNPLGLSWVSNYSPFCAWIGGWTQKPSFVDNLGYGSMNYQGVMDYIDELFEGNYDGHSGEIAPTGGAGGGGGSFSRPTIGIGIPALPSVSVCDTGMVSVYSVSTAQLQALATYMWDQDFFDNLVKLFQSPLDNIISLQSVPLVPGAMSGTGGSIVIGNIDTGLACNKKLSTTYYEVNCGTVSVPEIFKTFADYSPYTPAIELVLPYIGIHRLSPDDCMRGKINVVYHIDVFSGACVAFVNCYTNGVWTVLAEHSGSCIAQFPITGANFASVYIGAINSIGAAATGNFIGGVSNFANIKPEYGRSGGITSTAGVMGIQKPYLIFSEPKYITASNYRDVKGYTSNLTVKIGSQSGFLQATADNSELSGIGCTVDELDILRRQLADGIYI